MHAVFGPGAVGAIRLPRRGPALLLSDSVPLGRGSTSVLGPHVMPLLLPYTLLYALAWAVKRFLSPSYPRLSSPVTPLPLVSTPEVSSPLGQSVHSGGVNALRRLDCPSHSWAVPPGVFHHSVGIVASSVFPHSEVLARHSVGLAALLSASHSIGLACWVLPLAGNHLPSLGSCPMAASHS